MRTRSLHWSDRSRSGLPRRASLLAALLLLIGITAAKADEAAQVATTQEPIAGELLTAAERSNYRATTSNEEVAAFCARLVKSSKRASSSTLGTTGEGRPIPLLMLADPPITTPEQAAASGKLVVLLVGNIHGGEVDGKEALLMLARSWASASPTPELLKQFVIAIVPNFNPDGNARVAKDNRPGQDGPAEGMGTRTNAAGHDLNRDFAKLETPEVRGLMRWINLWNPAIVIDCHTTNGSYHRYAITYAGPRHPATPEPLAKYARETLLPAVTKQIASKDMIPSFWYGNFDPDHKRWIAAPALARFGTNMIGLRGRLAILSESYSYAPYKDRIHATRAFVSACLEQAASHPKEIREVLRAANSVPSSVKVALRSRPEVRTKGVTVLGYEETSEDGHIRSTGTPKDYVVDFVDTEAPTENAELPEAYLVPKRFTKAIEALQRHGLKLQELREDRELDVDYFIVKQIQRSERVFQDHKLVTLEVSPVSAPRRIEAGTILVPTSQSLGRLAAVLLEPRSEDSLATWNAFDDGLTVGKDYPVYRLSKVGNVLLARLNPLPEDRTPPKPFGRQSGLAGMAGMGMRGGGTTWLDGKTWLSVQQGRLSKVDVLTGRAVPFHDPAAMEAALSKLPTIGTNAARLARQTSFQMDPQRLGTLIEHDGDLYYARFDGSLAVRLTRSPKEESIARFSPNGQFVSFIRDNNLWVVDIATQTERALTEDGSALIFNGKASWVYWEEIFLRKDGAYWWSPDSSTIAFLKFDDAPVPEFLVINEVKGRQTIERTRYPRVGEANPSVQLGLVSPTGGEQRFVDLSTYQAGMFIISHVNWTPNSRELHVHVQDRSQTWLDLVAVSSASGAPRRLFRESNKGWLESPGEPSFLADGSFLWTSDADGWRHLVLVKPDGTKVRQVTKGPWDVREVLRVDEKAGSIYLTATKDNAIGLDFYAVPLKAEGGEPRRLTKERGTHSISLGPDGALFVDRWSNGETPDRSAVLNIEGGLARTLDTNPMPERSDYEWPQFHQVQIPAKDGTTLFGEVVLPAKLDPRKHYPVWIQVYGGPRMPTVRDSWQGGRMSDRLMANDGFIVFHVDPRSASNHGAASGWAAYRKLGVTEVADLEDAVRWLCARYPNADPARVGITGHSYGGYMTCYAMTHSKLFAAGIAGAPVTDWRLYDSIYTERYMGLPQDNPEGYELSSAITAARNLHGKLLIAHGDIDDNVHIQNTLRFVTALQAANKEFEMMIYPTARHGWGGEHYQKLKADFIKRTLGGPKDREVSPGAVATSPKASGPVPAQSSATPAVAR